MISSPHMEGMRGIREAKYYSPRSIEFTPSADPLRTYNILSSRLSIWLQFHKVEQRFGVAELIWIMKHPSFDDRQRFRLARLHMIIPVDLVSPLAVVSDLTTCISIV